MVPYLERTLDLSREYSSYFAPYENVADPHIDDADEGMTTASTRNLFAELKRQLAPMLRTICEQPAADDSSLRRTFAKGTQFDFALHVAESLGSHHPFCTRFSAGDVRITTRVIKVLTRRAFSPLLRRARKNSSILR
jgi:carboxypeptidase Taq